MRKARYIFSSMVLFFSLSSFAETFSEGWTLMYQGKFDTAHRVFSELADSNEPYGLFGLGVMNQYGYGVEKNEKKAMQLYLEAANRGVVEACHNIGFLYQHGKGTPQELSKAIEWYAQAAEMGYGPSQYDLGFMYENGIGTAVDLGKALSLYQKASEQQIPQALYSIGLLYYYGKAVKVDYLKSYAYIKAAVLLGLQEAEADLKWPGKKLKSSDLESADKLARELAGR